MEFAAEESCERILSDLTDGEEDDECFSSAMVELPSVVVREYSRCLKRRYDDAFVDVDKPRQWNKSSRRRRMHEQFEVLRAVVPDFCSDEKSSILTGAYEYIAKLQRLEAELRCELPDIEFSSEEEEGVSGCDDQESCRADSNAGAEASSSYCWSHCSLATVEVKRTEDGLQMHVECETRPGLMLRMMEMLESWGLSMDQANIECVDQRLIFDGTGSTEVEDDDGENRTARDLMMSAEFVGARLRSLIGDQTQEAMN